MQFCEEVLETAHDPSLAGSHAGAWRGQSPRLHHVLGRQPRRRPRRRGAHRAALQQRGAGADERAVADGGSVHADAVPHRDAAADHGVRQAAAGAA